MDAVVLVATWGDWMLTRALAFEWEKVVVVR
jgi:hypothetical protein